MLNVQTRGTKFLHFLVLRGNVAGLLSQLIIPIQHISFVTSLRGITSSPTSTLVAAHPI